MDKVVVGLFLVGIIAGLLYFGGAGTGYQIGASQAWSPRDYVPAPGECFVPPQGDGVYDAFYAQEVNAPNCSAFESQSNAWKTNADAEAVEWKTFQSRIATSFLAFVGVCIVGFFVYVIVRH